MRRRLGAMLIAALVAALPIGVPATRADSSALPWLRVDHRRGNARAEIVDQYGRTVLLRGVNVTGLEDDWIATSDGHQPLAPRWPVSPSAYEGTCPANAHDIVEPPLCEIDFTQLHGLGFNVVRLTLSWSLLEPTPGRYDRAYLDRIEQVVGWARAQNIHVLLDMHQDAYSRFIPETAATTVPPIVTTTPGSGNHNDGAPPWAIVTNGEPSVGLVGIDFTNARMEAAFTSFWLNRTAPGPKGAAPGVGLQDHYIGAMAALARRFRSDSTVVGYEIMNEPLPGTLPPVAFESGFLYPFYRRVIDAITGTRDGLPCPSSTPAVAACGYPDLGVHDTRHAFFFEPLAARNLVDVAVGPSAPFSTFPNLVYAPHVYTHVFTLDALAPIPGLGGVFPHGYDQAYLTADAEARLLGAALWIGEYGNGSNQDDDILAAQTAAQDRARVGSALWEWKANCGPGSSASGCPGTWGVYRGDGAPAPAPNLEIVPSRERYLSRVYPRAIAGVLNALAYDPVHHTATVSATAALGVAVGDRQHEMVMYIPASVSGAITVTGAGLDVVETQLDGSRLVYIAPHGGAYTVEVSA